jgi:hypothetical protein
VRTSEIQIIMGNSSGCGQRSYTSVSVARCGDCVCADVHTRAL